NTKAALVQDIAIVLSETRDVRGKYENEISPLEQKAIDSAANSVAEVKKLLNYNANSIDLVISSLKSYSSLADQSKDSLIKSRNEAVEMERQLSALISDIKSIGDNEAYQKFVNLLQTDPDLLSEFISSPVEISDEYVYPVENNGSMTAPFYIVLSIWVGALIMSTILKTAVKDTTGMNNLKNWQCFFGRFFVTFVIGQLQTIITVMGAFLFVGIQCEHPFYFWLACAWTSLIYSLLLYSFTYSFGNVGEALSVILMVIQVAGAGGTFPIEVLPKVFQVLYKFMPFNYSMNALRECIAGFYKDTYRNCMLTLIIYGIVAIFVGIVLYYPFKILNEKIESSKEKSGILI
ncbi:MAG: YhgE/Pip domain-containing protein, partial [Pseudobutyrivibrio sp.]|nr:YhgE/Pip domain-containing protein [Pseudobutyrivibrio sp.]